MNAKRSACTELHNYQEDYVNIAEYKVMQLPFHLGQQGRLCAQSALNTRWSLKLI